MLQIGDRVVIVGDHPHAGKSGILEGCYNGVIGKAVKIVFDDGDGCFVFQNSGAKLIPERRKEPKR